MERMADISRAVVMAVQAWSCALSPCRASPSPSGARKNGGSDAMLGSILSVDLISSSIRMRRPLSSRRWGARSSVRRES